MNMHKVIFYSFSQIKIKAKYEHVNVTKVVVLVLRIPEHFSLHFYYFYTNCYVFLKFTVLKFKHILQFDPCKFWFF